mgnify:CR=1 FL=1
MYHPAMGEEVRIEPRHPFGIRRPGQFTLIVLGLGLANVIPLLFVAASRVDGVSAASGIALVSSLGWVGVVIGPPLVGGVAQASSLAWALWLVVLSSLALAAAARRVD